MSSAEPQHGGPVTGQHADLTAGGPDGTAAMPAAGLAAAGLPAAPSRRGPARLTARSLTAPLARVPLPPALKRRRLPRLPVPGRRLPPAGEHSGALLARLTALPAVLVVAWLIPALALLAAGRFEPGPQLLIFAVLAVVLVAAGLRAVPARWPRLLPGGRKAEPGWQATFGLAATVVVVVAVTAWQLAEASQSLVVTRDPGVYLQAGYWIAHHATMAVPQLAADFGRSHPGLHFTSTGFLARGSSVYPAVAPGLPALLAAGFWAHGAVGASLAGPVLGGLALLAFAGLVARLVGPQWAPAGALVLGVSLPQQYVGRTSLAQTTLQVLIFGGLCLFCDALAVRAAKDPAGCKRAVARLLARAGAVLSPLRVLSALAGLALGLGLLVSFDALVYLVPVIPFGCALAISRRPQTIPFLAGGVAGTACGLAGAWFLDRPFLDTVGQSATFAGVVAVWLLALSAVAFQLHRLEAVRRLVPRVLQSRPAGWLPVVTGVAVLAGLVGLLVRPYVQKVHGGASSALVAALQRQQDLPLDPTRLYSEQTLYWVIWYVGLPTVLLGAFGLALVVRRCTFTVQRWKDPTSVWRAWSLPGLLILVGAVTVLWSPGTDPDQPWASRRLVLLAIPGLILGALWAAAWLARRARERGARAVTAAVAGVFCWAAMVVPTAATTFGVGLTHTASNGGLHTVVQGLARQRTGTGEEMVVATLCARIPDDASVVIVGEPLADQFTQVVRGMCGVPAAWLPASPATSVYAAFQSVAAAGRQPVLLAATAGTLRNYGGTPVHVVTRRVKADPQDLTQLPTVPQWQTYRLWMVRPEGAGAGSGGA